MTKLLTVGIALLVLLGTGMECGVQYTVLVDREDELFLLAGGYIGSESSLEAGDKLRADFEVLESGGPIDFLVLSDADLARWEAGQQYEAVLAVVNSTGATRTATIPATGDYWVLASNRQDSTASRKLSYEVWRAAR